MESRTVRFLKLSGWNGKRNALSSPSFWVCHELQVAIWDFCVYEATSLYFWRTERHPQIFCSHKNRKKNASSSVNHLPVCVSFSYCYWFAAFFFLFWSACRFMLALCSFGFRGAVGLVWFVCFRKRLEQSMCVFDANTCVQVRQARAKALHLSLEFPSSLLQFAGQVTQSRYLCSSSLSTKKHSRASDVKCEKQTRVNFAVYMCMITSDPRCDDWSL